jgi:hypothetical protein
MTVGESAPLISRAITKTQVASRVQVLTIDIRTLSATAPNSRIRGRGAGLHNAGTISTGGDAVVMREVSYVLEC